MHTRKEIKAISINSNISNLEVKVIENQFSESLMNFYDQFSCYIKFACFLVRSFKICLLEVAVIEVWRQIRILQAQQD